MKETAGSTIRTFRGFGRILEGIVREARILFRLARHPRTPWTVRIVAGAALAYLMSPVQVLPNFIPVLGQADDLFVIWCATKFARLVTPPQLLIECGGIAEPVDPKDI